MATSMSAKKYVESSTSHDATDRSEKRRANHFAAFRQHGSHQRGVAALQRRRPLTGFDALVDLMDRSVLMRDF